MVQVAPSSFFRSFAFSLNTLAFCLNKYKIKHQGFDHRLGHGEYGQGTYFAEHALYAVAYAEGWIADSSSITRMMLHQAEKEKPLLMACSAK